jgi:hypothetical protein
MQNRFAEKQGNGPLHGTIMGVNQESVPWPDGRYRGTNTHSLSYHVLNDIIISRIFLLKQLFQPVKKNLRDCSWKFPL